jgi:hypothetical protein
MPGQIHVRNLQKCTYQENLRCCQLDFEGIVTTIHRRIIDRCRYVDFSWASAAQFFLRALRVVRLIAVQKSSRYFKM